MYQRGIGFLISKRLYPHVTVVRQISDNVAFVDFDLPSKNGKPTKCRLVNAYGPTSPSAKKNPRLVKNFYSELSSVVKVPVNYELFICGDINARVGKLSKADFDTGMLNHVGKYALAVETQMRKLY